VPSEREKGGGGIPVSLLRMRSVVMYKKRGGRRGKEVGRGELPYNILAWQSRILLRKETGRGRKEKGTLGEGGRKGKLLGFFLRFRSAGGGRRRGREKKKKNCQRKGRRGEKKESMTGLVPRLFRLREKRGIGREEGTLLKGGREKGAQEKGLAKFAEETTTLTLSVFIIRGTKVEAASPKERKEGERRRGGEKKKGAVATGRSTFQFTGLGALD